MQPLLVGSRPACPAAAAALITCGCYYLLVALLASSPSLPGGRLVRAASTGGAASEKLASRHSLRHAANLAPHQQAHHRHRHHRRRHPRHHYHHQQHQHGHDHEQHAGLGQFEPNEEAVGSSWRAPFDIIGPSHWPLSADPSPIGSRADWSSRADGRRSRRAAALKLAVNRLKILESLDDQLREFASDLVRRSDELAGSIGRCELPLEFLGAHGRGPERHSGRDEPGGELHGEEDYYDGEPAKSPSCLSSDHLRRQVPAYMLNLHTRIRAEARSSREAVQLMPYRSLRMRSLRQPPLLEQQQPPSTFQLHQQPQPQQQQQQQQPSSSSSSALVRASAGRRPAQDPSEVGPADELRMFAQVVQSELVVELNLMEQQQQHHPHEATASSIRAQMRPTDEGERDTLDGQSSSSYCDLSERLRPARDRTQLCFWFRLNQPSERRTTMNGSLGRPEKALMDENELLVEAELHLFKLRPDPELLKRQQHHHTQLNSSLGGNKFHLRTNLLEVSLYQILPKERDDESENALRLIDIRRIDLDSSGWESFYVKRAVQDWLSDSSSNLGLVIKAKSMFDEPIRIGLIRFADLYDHHHLWPAQTENLIEDNENNQASKEATEFDLSHQPALVIYTSSKQTTDRP